MRASGARRYSTVPHGRSRPGFRRRQRPFVAEREADYTVLPHVTFTSPAIASAGLTGAELTRTGRVLAEAAI
jgi:hypothetical protein